MYYVDIPPYPNDSIDITEDVSWINLSSFETKEEAIDYIRKYIGYCDDEGNVCLITKGESNDED